MAFDDAAREYGPKDIFYIQEMINGSMGVFYTNQTHSFRSESFEDTVKAAQALGFLLCSQDEITPEGKRNTRYLINPSHIEQLIELQKDENPDMPPGPKDEVICATYSGPLLENFLNLRLPQTEFSKARKLGIEIRQQAEPPDSFKRLCA